MGTDEDGSDDRRKVMHSKNKSQYFRNRQVELFISIW
jgi:hypothetical protein